MSGNVVQHISDLEWERTLKDLRRVSDCGTVITFESRNPLRKEWENWIVPASAPLVRETVHGVLNQWTEVEILDNSRVMCCFFNRFDNCDDIIQENIILKFRSKEEISRQLRGVGFHIDAVWGNWNRSPFRDSDPVMIFKAHAE